MAGFIFSGGAGGGGGNVGTDTFLSTGSTTARNNATRWSEIKNVMDFGAVADGVTNDSTAINAAIVAAGSTGSNTLGGGVFFPPGNYGIGASIVPYGGRVALFGLNPYACKLTALGSLATGYVVDMNPASNGQFDRIENLSISSGQTASGFDKALGALRFEAPSSAAGGVIRNCNISGWNGIRIGINAGSDTSFNTIIDTCQITGPTSTVMYGTRGILAFNATLINTTVNGYWYGITLAGAGGLPVLGCRVESCNTGIVMGLDEDAAAYPVSGATVKGFTTEQCLAGININNASSGSLQDYAAIGTIGPLFQITTISAAGTAWTVTVGNPTLDQLGWTSGTRKILIVQGDSSQPNNPFDASQGGLLTATRTGTSTFTMTGPRSPGSYPGPGGNSAYWQMQLQLGVIARTAKAFTMSNVTVSVNSTLIVYGIDLFTSDGELDCVTLNSVRSNGTPWVMPRSISKASVAYIACDNPGGSTNDGSSVVSGMQFADLPGQSSVQKSTPIQGDTYYITDGNQATIGSNVTAGGGGNKSYVIWNGTNWLRGV